MAYALALRLRFYSPRLHAITALLLTGCINSRSDPGANPTASAAAAVAAGVTSHRPAESTMERGQGEACLVDHNEPILDATEVTVVDPGSGKSMIRVGATPQSQAVRVTLAELRTKPEQFVGRLVHVEGKITAMCGHRRAWFAIANSDTPNAEALRIITAPRFLVPASSIGKMARAEGVVELREISKQAADHIAKEHGLASPARPIPLIQANGAEFY